METEALTNLILNSSVTIVVIAYFMYRDNKFMVELQRTLTTLVDTVDTLKEALQANMIVRSSERKGDKNHG